MAKLDPRKKAIKKFLRIVGRAQREEQVIDCYQRLLGEEDWQRPFGCDGLALKTLFDGGVLFESKFDKKLEDADGYIGLAQSCYYLRKIRQIGVYKEAHYRMPTKVVVCDKNEAAVIQTKDLEAFLSSDDYNWALPASSPDTKLISDLNVIRLVPFDMTTEPGVERFLESVSKIGDEVYQLITVDNFVEIFKIWQPQFATGLDTQEAALAFLLDLQKGIEYNEDKGNLSYETKSGKKIRVKANIADYRRFWSAYRLPPDPSVLAEIFARKDWLVAMPRRRSTGEFFTPEVFAKMAQKLLEKNFPSIFANYSVYDPACGTGNLEINLPAMPGRLFMSTLNEEDLDVITDAGMDKILGAKVFKYDFLNEPDSALPKALQAKLKPNEKMLFFLNPPFMGAADGQIKNSGKGGSNTVIRSSMKPTVGRACQNLLAQFLWRIGELIRNNQLDGMVGAFSKAIWITGPSYDKFRSDWESKFEFVDAFCFCSEEFEGASGKWPCVFSVWRSKNCSP